MSNLHIMYLSECCDFACKYCYEKDKKPTLMDPAVCSAWVDEVVSECTKDEFIPILLFGGEPLLNWPGVIATMERIRYWNLHGYAKIRGTMITNGSLLTEKRVRALFKYRPCMSIQVSFDGGPATQNEWRIFRGGGGTYDIVAKNAKTLLKYFPESTVKMTVASVNTMYEDFLHLAETIGFKSFDITARRVEGKGYEEAYCTTYYEQFALINQYLAVHPDKHINEATYPIASEKFEQTTSRDNLPDNEKHGEYKYLLPTGKVIGIIPGTQAGFQHFDENVGEKVL